MIYRTISYIVNDPFCLFVSKRLENSKMYTPKTIYILNQQNKGKVYLGIQTKFETHEIALEQNGREIYALTTSNRILKVPKWQGKLNPFDQRRITMNNK